MSTRLKACGFFLSSAEALPEIIPAKLEKPCIIVHEGRFNSMDGEVEITREQLGKFQTIHNARLTKLKTMFSSGVPLKVNPPIQLDHSTSATMTVGRLTGDVEVKEVETEQGRRLALVGKVTILGRENVEKVLDGRWAQVSIGADLEQGKINEVSITPFPADEDATLLSKGDDKGEKMDKEKLKKHLKEKHSLSDEDAEKKLSEGSEEELSKLAAECDEHEKKLAAEEDEKAKKLAAEEDEKKKLAAADEEAKETEKKTQMAAAKSKIIALAKGLKKTSADIKVASRATMVSAKLSSFRAQGKITPAELKKMDVTKLASASEEALNVMFSAYDAREPVIDSTVRGSSKSVDISKLAADYQRKKLALEMRLDMSLFSGDTKKQLAELEKSHGEQVRLAKEENAKMSETEIHIDTSPHAHYDAAYSRMCEMLDGGHDKEEIKKELKRLLDESAKGNAGADDKRMKSLVEDVSRLQTEVTELIPLVAAQFGVEAKEFE